MQLGGLGEQGLERSPSGNQILSLQYDIWWQQFYEFPRQLLWFWFFYLHRREAPLGVRPKAGASLAPPKAGTDELKLNFHSYRSTLLYMWPFVMWRIFHIYFQEEQSDQAPDVTRLIYSVYTLYTPTVLQSADEKPMSSKLRSGKE